MARLTRVLARPGASMVVVASMFAVAYLLMLGPRALEPTPDCHFVHLANSFLHGQLGVVGGRPLGHNDWACFDEATGQGCSPGALFSGGARESERWYVSFPPFPALLLLPFVYFWGIDVPDRAIFAAFAGLGPGALWWLLETLRLRGESLRGMRENALLVALFGLGTVYFFTAVQGTVWFAAHVVAVPLVTFYLGAALGARRPVLAGLMLGLAFMTRPTTAFLAPFFVLQACERARRDATPAAPGHPLRRAFLWLSEVSLVSLSFRLALFGLPLLLIGGCAMLMNEARFDDPFEFGHAYLQVRWRDRIERWGLFNYHYLAKNLSVFLAGLPWFSAVPPHIKISGHGLALWLTTPGLLWVLYPKRPWTPRMIALAVSAGVVALLDLLYQNSGWVQFGYRFALDYMPLLFVLLALGGRRFGPGFLALAVFSLLINGFGAVTFDRALQFYHVEATQNVLFQPD